MLYPQTLLIYLHMVIEFAYNLFCRNQRVLNFAQSKVVSLLCSVQNFKMIWQRKWVLWANGISLDSTMTSSNGNIFRVTGPLCGEFTGHRWIPLTRPVTRSFDVFFDLRLNERLSKQSWGWWFETPSRPLWRHRNASVRWVSMGYPILQRRPFRFSVGNLFELYCRVCAMWNEIHLLRGWCQCKTFQWKIHEFIKFNCPCIHLYIYDLTK